MKFIKQLSEDEFVVKMGLEDGDNVRSITLAHDYLKFNGRNWYCTNMQLKDTPWSYANVIDVRTSIQIPIRMAQDILENVLNKDRKYLKKEHLVRSDGTPGYSDPVGLSYRYSTDDGIKMIAVYSKEKNQYIHIPEDLYESIKTSIKATLEEE